MTSIRYDTTIDAPAESVWAVLSDLEAVERYSKGVRRARFTSDAKEGLGASRHCDLAPFGTVEERIDVWEPQQRLRLAIFENTKMPFTRATADFSLTDEGEATRVSVLFDYTPRFGFVGRLLNPLGLRTQMQRGMKGLLTGLRRDVEARAATEH